MHGGETGERRTVLNTTLVQALAHLGAVLAARVRGKQRGHVVRRGLLLLCGMQDRGSLPRLFAPLIGLHGEVDDARR